MSNTARAAAWLGDDKRFIKSELYTHFFSFLFAHPIYYLRTIISPSPFLLLGITQIRGH